MSCKTTNTRVTWGGIDNRLLTLAATAQVSDAIDVSFVDMITVYALYTPGANSSALSFTVELSPFDAAERAANGELWGTVGYYADATTGSQVENTSGDWEGQPAALANDTTGITAGTPFSIVPYRIDVTNAKAIRITALETLGSGSTFGTALFVIGKNDY